MGSKIFDSQQKHVKVGATRQTCSPQMRGERHRCKGKKQYSSIRTAEWSWLCSGNVYVQPVVKLWVSCYGWDRHIVCRTKEMFIVNFADSRRLKSYSSICTTVPKNIVFLTRFSHVASWSRRGPQIVTDWMDSPKTLIRFSPRNQSALQ
jgi:hypothetical protein